VHELLLTPPTNAYKRVRKPIVAASEEGRSQIVKDAKGTKTDIPELLQRLIDLTVSRVVNEVQSAAASIIAALGVLGLDRNEIEDRIKQELDDRSDAPFERIAAQAVNAAVNEGRREEMDARKDEIEYYVWSAILDKNTCGPCEALDGTEADSLDQLPDAPYDECEGGANCRCFVISVFKTETQ
jgi:SPP1 gp7 family putative phage head morphogenesis protein